MQHYFIEKDHKDSDYFEFETIVAGEKLTLRSCDNIFSKDEVDKGSLTLINTIVDQLNLSGYGLDFGCGYGVIGITLLKKFKLFIDFADVNKTAIELTRSNLLKNGIKSAGNLIKTNGFENITKKDYDFIVTNPPIKTGKKLLFEIMQGCYDSLKDGGTLTLVIRKEHGEESLKKHLIGIFGNCEILKRNKGFYILHCVKNSNQTQKL